MYGDDAVAKGMLHAVSIDSLTDVSFGNSVSERSVENVAKKTAT